MRRDGTNRWKMNDGRWMMYGKFVLIEKYFRSKIKKKNLFSFCIILPYSYLCIE